jgi:hypothetical protein
MLKLFRACSLVYRTVQNGLKNTRGASQSQRQANHINSLSALVSGIVQSKSVKLDDIAGEVPRTGKMASQVMQIRRWLKNKNINIDLHYLPFMETVLSCLAQQPLVLIIDGSSTARGYMTLMVSVVYQKRSLPLLWVTRKGKKEHFPEALHIDLITAVKAIIPELAEVVCLGDGEFDGTEWLETITRFGWLLSVAPPKRQFFMKTASGFHSRTFALNVANPMK